jgi:thiol-disulfide isomerase/thioredoxin
MNSDEEFEKKSSQNAYTYAQFNFIKSKLTDPELKSKKAGDAMYEQVMYYTTDSIDDLMADFLALCTDTVKINEVNSIIDKKKKIAKGMPAPNFETVDAENNPVSLADFKGKYVYVDFWASWCGPCKKEIPYFKSLSSEFEGENIAFLSVSVDAKKEDWEKALETHEMTGSQLYIGSSDIIRNVYMVRSIPRFVLIDTEGNFISSNAPRPSSDEIKNMLNDLI